MIPNQHDNDEASLLYNLRSNCHEAKQNFRKIHKNNLNCIFGCQVIENQKHIFSKCQPVLSKISYTIAPYEHIFGDITQQKSVIPQFIQIEYIRNEMKEKLLPGGGDDAAARTQQIYNL